MPRTRVKVLTKAMLETLNNKALRAQANRALNADAVRKLPANMVFPISDVLLHNDVDARATIVLDSTGATAQLDMSLVDYDRIPTVEYEP